jgi:hypothetical protein
MPYFSIPSSVGSGNPGVATVTMVERSTDGSPPEGDDPEILGEGPMRSGPDIVEGEGCAHSLSMVVDLSNRMRLST